MQLLDLGLRHFLLGWSCFVLFPSLIGFNHLWRKTRKPPKWQDPTDLYRIYRLFPQLPGLTNYWLLILPAITKTHGEVYIFFRHEIMKLTSIHDSRLNIYKKMGVPKGKNSYPHAGALGGPQFLVDGMWMAAITKTRSCASLLSCYLCQLTWWVRHLKK